MCHLIAFPYTFLIVSQTLCAYHAIKDIIVYIIIWQIKIVIGWGNVKCTYKCNSVLSILQFSKWDERKEIFFFFCFKSSQHKIVIVTMPEWDEIHTKMYKRKGNRQYVHLYPDGITNEYYIECDKIQSIALAQVHSAPQWYLVTVILTQKTQWTQTHAHTHTHINLLKLNH